MQKYSITYREEFIVEVEAADKEDALKKAANSKNWEMLQEGHLDFFKVEEN